MTFIDHLEELRWHIMRSLLAIVIGAIVIFVYMDKIFDKIILGPMEKDFATYIGLCKFSHWIGAGDSLCLPPPNARLITTEFGSQFMTSITVAVAGGFICAFPYIFYVFCNFVRP